jgi:hypothetical protein
MNKDSFTKIFILLICVSTFAFSCKSKKKAKATETAVVVAIDSTASDKCKLDFKSGKVLAKHMKEKELDFTYASAKFNCELTLDNEDHSFNHAFIFHKIKFLIILILYIILFILFYLFYQNKTKAGPIREAKLNNIFYHLPH